MILLSLGNLGDLLIQAAFLRRFDRADVSIAVPASYAAIAAELFPIAPVIPLPDRTADGRLAIRSGTDRAAVVASLVAGLQAQHPSRTIVSIALTDDLIRDRALNIYEAYWRLLTREPAIAPYLPTEGFPRSAESWTPFPHLPRWRKPDAKTVWFCPWGGIALKQIPTPDLRLLFDVCRRLDFDARLLASPRDDASAYPFVEPAKVRGLDGDRMIRTAAEQFTSASLVVAVDTAWYHLAALLGAPVLGIPGPRSLRHFEFPGFRHAESASAERPCVDCYSVDRCVVTDEPCCEARPDATVLAATLETVLTGQPASPPRRHPATFIHRPVLVRRLGRLTFRAIDTSRRLLIEPALRLRSR